MEISSRAPLADDNIFTAFSNLTYNSFLHIFQYIQGKRTKRLNLGNYEFNKKLPALQIFQCQERVHFSYYGS